MNDNTGLIGLMQIQGATATQYPTAIPAMTDPSQIQGSLGIPITNEKARITNRLADFNPKDNPVWKEITMRFGANIKQPELLSIANVLASSANVRLDRDAKRRKSVLIKWFEENWAAISPFLDYVVLEDQNTETTPGQTQ